MARTPSKITKRDIDKDLYLEIVNEASNETNVQKLLDDYVRKDEGIAEWQLPTKYRQNLTKRLNDIDSDVQNMKNDTTQKTWNDDILKRIQVIEKKEGINTGADEDVSPIVGTQVAANTSNISKNSKQILVLQGQIKELESTHNTDRANLENANSRLQVDVNSKLGTTTRRMDKLETLLSGKRNKTDLITQDDLDDSIRKNIHAVLNIGDSTISALDNLDSLVKRVDTYDDRIRKNEQDTQKAVSDVTTMRVSIEKNLAEQVETLSDTEKKDVKNVNDVVSQLSTDTTDSITSLREQINSINTTKDRQEKRVEEINEKVENMAVSVQNNEVNIVGVSDQLALVSSDIAQQKKSIDTLSDSIDDKIAKAQLHKDIEKGKLLTADPESGVLIGRDLVTMAYMSYDSATLNMFLHQSLSPILDVDSDTLYIAKTSKEIEAEAKAAGSTSSDAKAGGATDSKTEGSSDTTTDASSESGSTSGDKKVDMDSKSDREQWLSDIAKDNKELLKKYKAQEHYMASPARYNTFLFNMELKILAAFIDGGGKVHSFETWSAASAPRDVEVEAGEIRSYPFSGLDERGGVRVLVRDQKDNSPTKGKWINSEGVITVAYDAASYMVVNNSMQKQYIRIIEV